MPLTLASGIQVHGHTTPNGPITDGNANREVYGCFVSFRMTGTYDQAANAQITGLPAIIQASRRDGRIVTLLAAGLALAAPGREAGLVTGVKTLAVAGANVTFEITTADLNTERAATVFADYDQLITLFVAYELSAI